MVVLFVASFILGILPILLNKRFQWSTQARNSIFVRFLLGLGGGVLLCTTFIHLVPEVKEQFQTIHMNGYVKKRFAEILLCIGFFLMYFIEECVHSYLHYKERHMSVLRRSLLIRRGETAPKFVATEEEPVEHFHEVGHSHTPEFDSSNTTAIIRGLLVVLALSVHELFEGLAVGLESASNKVWYMFGAISAHKLVIAFCVGVELVASRLNTCFTYIYVLIFAIVSPLGIGLGIIVSNLKETNAVIYSVTLQGLASGTLVYVVFFEILQGDKRCGMLQYFSIVTGFGIMFGITWLDLGDEY